MIIKRGHELPEIRDLNYTTARIVWPQFMLHDDIGNRFFGELFDSFPEYQFGFFDENDKSLIAMGNSIPLYWDKPFDQLPDSGWDWVLQEGVEQFKKGIKPNIFSAIQIMIPPELKGRGISYEAVEYMKSIGRENDLKALIAPVRPNLKPNYPLIDIHEYIKWRREDNLPFDAWLRVHEKHGAKIIKPCPQAMKISGSIDEWIEWTDQTFPGSGQYIIPGALNPITIDLENDIGVYTEPNVWMVHEL